MTYEEALREFDEVLMPEVAVKFSNPKCGLFPMIRAALEKQIPKKPKITIYNGSCECCGIAWGRDRLINERCYGYKYFQFCPICGQAIDWSANDE